MAAAITLLVSVLVFATLAPVKEGVARPSMVANRQSGGQSIENRLLKQLIQVVSQKMTEHRRGNYNVRLQQAEMQTCNENELLQDIYVFEHLNGKCMI